jgi:hypothetical protein
MTSDDVLDPYVAVLLEEQMRLGWTNQRFADYLGIDRAVWSRLRRAERDLSIVTIRTVFKRYPHADRPHLPSACIPCRLSRALAESVPDRLAS